MLQVPHFRKYRIGGIDTFGIILPITTEMYPGKVMVDKPLIQMCCNFNLQCNVTVIHQVLYTKCYLNNYGSTQLDYNALAICAYITPQTSVTITCGIQTSYWCCYLVSCSQTIYVPATYRCPDYKRQL